MQIIFLNFQKYYKKYGDGVNEFWITNNTQENPCLVVLVNKEMANLTYFPDEESLGFQSVGCQTNQKNDYCIFILIRLKKRLKSEEIQLSQ